MAPETTWRKSTRSQNGQNCVEVNGTLDHLRDSKNPTGPALPINVPTLINALKENRFTH